MKRFAELTNLNQPQQLCKRVLNLIKWLIIPNNRCANSFFRTDNFFEISFFIHVKNNNWSLDVATVGECCKINNIDSSATYLFAAEDVEFKSFTILCRIGIVDTVNTGSF